MKEKKEDNNDGKICPFFIYYKTIKDIKLRNFLKKSYFDGYCKTSAKTGKNINEAVEFVIKEIIEKTKYLEKKDQKFCDERKTIIFESKISGEKENKRKNGVSKNNQEKKDKKNKNDNEDTKDKGDNITKDDDENASKCCCPFFWD